MARYDGAQPAAAGAESGVQGVRESGDQLPVNRMGPIEPWRDFRARPG
jgi:hypothetical protein